MVIADPEAKRMDIVPVNVADAAKSANLPKAAYADPRIPENAVQFRVTKTEGGLVVDPTIEGATTLQAALRRDIARAQKTTTDQSGMQHTIGKYPNMAVTDKGVADIGRDLPLPPHITDLGALAGKRVLDVGAGGGTFVRQLMNAGADAYGVDFQSDKFRAVVPSGASNDHFIETDALKLPMKDATFDVVYSNYSVFYYFNRHQAASAETGLRELARVVKPGGSIRLIGADNNLPNLLHKVPELSVAASYTGHHGTIPVLELTRR
jgi:SAM-dependent methyltransferase